MTKAIFRVALLAGVMLLVFTCLNRVSALEASNEVITFVYTQEDIQPSAERSTFEPVAFADTIDAVYEEYVGTFVSSDPSITFSYEYIKDDSKQIIPYGLYTPSTAATNEKTPLIVWLHGNGERNVSSDALYNSGLLHTLNKWSMEGFNAYVVTPHLSYGFDTGLWMKPKAVEYLTTLLEHLMTQYNIDTDRIILCGHSLGGQGSIYIASMMPDTFSCVAVLSGYDCYEDLPISIPMIAYEGHPNCGESSTSYNYMKGKFQTTYPDAEVRVLNSSHVSLPYDAFTLDENQDGKSDLIEWMLSYIKA